MEHRQEAHAMNITSTDLAVGTDVGTGLPQPSGVPKPVIQLQVGTTPPESTSARSDVVRPDVGKSLPRYTRIPHALVQPVYIKACQLRFSQPTPETIIEQTQTELDVAVVKGLIEAALRLLPPDDTPEGIRARKKKEKEKAAQAKRAEDAFLRSLTKFGYKFLGEAAQRKAGKFLTPDVRFKQPVSICNHLCYWLEYKSYFGFRANPFLASKDKKQVKKYVTGIGPGAVVYRMGYETGYPNIEGAMAFREIDVLNYLSVRKVAPPVP